MGLILHGRDLSVFCLFFPPSFRSVSRGKGDSSMGEEVVNSMGIYCCYWYYATSSDVIGVGARIPCHHWPVVVAPRWGAHAHECLPLLSHRAAARDGYLAARLFAHLSSFRVSPAPSCESALVGHVAARHGFHPISTRFFC